MVDQPLEFIPMLPEDIQLIVPTTYSKLNLLNHCQYLKSFIRDKAQLDSCCHTVELALKTETVKNIIAQILETESVFSVIRSQTKKDEQCKATCG